MEYKWTALTVTIVGTIMAGVDTRIVIIGLPTIAAQIHAGAGELIWITQAYIVASTIIVLLIGRITDVFGRVKLYNMGFVVFTIGSLLCSLSPDPYVLIGCRVVQGVGSGMLGASSAAIITDAAPKSELGTMLGINTSAFRIGNVAGLTLSGLILSVTDWRGLFWVNIPIGIFGTYWSYTKLREISKKDTVKKMDWPGIALFSVGLTMVLLAITYLSYGGAGRDEGFGILLVGFVLLAIFAKAESRTASPLLDLRLFKILPFAMGNIAQIMNSVAFYGALLMVSFYLQISLGFTPLQAGLGILPLDGTYLVFCLISGKLSDWYGSRVIATIGLLVGTLGFFGMYTFGATTPYYLVAILLVIVGVGNGMFAPPNASSVMGSVPANRVGVASGFRSTVFSIGQTASYGLLILFITFAIPYSHLTLLLQGTEPQSGLLLAKEQFLNGVRIAILILATVNAFAIIPSAMRGKRKTQDTPTEASQAGVSKN